MSPEADIIEIQDMPELHKFVFDMYMLECERIQQEMLERTNALMPPPTQNQMDNDFDFEMDDNPFGEDANEEELINFDFETNDDDFEPERAQPEHIGEYGGEDSDQDDNELQRHVNADQFAAMQRAGLDVDGLPMADGGVVGGGGLLEEDEEEEAQPVDTFKAPENIEYSVDAKGKIKFDEIQDEAEIEEEDDSDLKPPGEE